MGFEVTLRTKELSTDYVLFTRISIHKEKQKITTIKVQLDFKRIDSYLIFLQDNTIFWLYSVLYSNCHADNISMIFQNLTQWL